MHTALDFVVKVLVPLGILAVILSPWIAQKYYESQHPDEIHFDPEHDSPEVLAFILNKKAKEKEEKDKLWETYWYD